MSAKTFLNRLLHDERGATAVEYGLILVLIVVAMIVALQGVAGETIEMWTSVQTKVEQAANF